MLLKRKRSGSEFGSVFSSTQQLDGNRFNFDAMSAMDTARRGFFAQRLSAPSHLHSRTLKRFRDNRPSESEIYQHTLDVLYSAQRRLDEPPTAPPSFSARSDVEALPQHHAHDSQSGQQRSLHSFWNLPKPASPASSTASSPASSAASLPVPALGLRSIPTNCEDCGAGLTGCDDDTMMDVDGYGYSIEDQICRACQKAVCSSCSVSILGEHRRCLVCAGPRRGNGDGLRTKG